MLQLWVIALLVTVYVHDGLAAGVHRHTQGGAWSWWAAAATLVPYVVLAGATEGVCRACAREMDRTGSQRALVTAERTVGLSRIAAVVTTVLAVYTLGWVEQVRAVTGGIVMGDELAAVLPALLVFVAGWWSFYPIEQRLRGASWVRILEEGLPAYPTPSRWQFVWSNVRHQLLFVLVPLAMFGLWNEGTDWAIDHAPAGGGLGRAARWIERSAQGELARYGIHLVGMALVFLLTPLLMRLVWDAVPLGAGPLRDRLMRVCERAGVRVRELLVWRTYGTMLNGAAMGLIAPLRYILLTDALLDHLPERQVEGVMAHEVGHVKHHHIPWMVFGLVAVMGLGMAVAGVVLMGAVLAAPFVLPRHWALREQDVAVMQAAAIPVALVIAFGGFGWVSRRFEWQADAFAVKQLSLDEPGAKTITPEAAEAMCGALGAVAEISHVDTRSGGFRHGSIALRQNRLRRLVGTPLGRLPIDRTVRWVKGGIVVGVVLVAGTMAVQGIARESMEHGRGPYEFERIRPMEWPQSTLEDAP